MTARPPVIQVSPAKGTRASGHWPEPISRYLRPQKLSAYGQVLQACEARRIAEVLARLLTCASRTAKQLGGDARHTPKAERPGPIQGRYVIAIQGPPSIAISRTDKSTRNSSEVISIDFSWIL